jgi:hypothetical protein
MRTAADTSASADIGLDGATFDLITRGCRRKAADVQQFLQEGTWPAHLTIPGDGTGLTRL